MVCMVTTETRSEPASRFYIVLTVGALLSLSPIFYGCRLNTVNVKDAFCPYTPCILVPYFKTSRKTSLFLYGCRKMHFTRLMCHADKSSRRAITITKWGRNYYRHLRGTWECGWCGMDVRAMLAAWVPRPALSEFRSSGHSVRFGSPLP